MYYKYKSSLKSNSINKIFSIHLEGHFWGFGLSPDMENAEYLQI